MLRVTLFKVPSVSPLYFFPVVSLFVVTLALLMTLEVRQLFFRGQWFYFLQLQLLSVEGILLVSRIFLLCFLIMVCRFFVQL